METRQIKELLQIMLDNVEQVKYAGGLCALSLWLRIINLITEKEEDKIDAYIGDHLPNKNVPPRWAIYEIPPRRDFLQQLINDIEEQEKAAEKSQR